MEKWGFCYIVTSEIENEVIQMEEALKDSILGALENVIDLN
ncbi:PaaD-like protein (DUF59) involved in Fe-S cluster assembly [Staphylococcus pseudintermedius]|nr:PaaD-like protein (DUF59) involved in Fe-S cluster assembly [Staphylococcus pseudintermedius]